MNSIEDLLNSFFQSSPNTVRAAEGGLMGSPMPNTPMSGGQNPPMGGAPQQNSSMSGGQNAPMGGAPQQSSTMSGGQQFVSSPTSTPPQNTFNPYMGGGGTASQLSMGPGAQPYGQGIGGLQSLGGEEMHPALDQQKMVGYSQYFPQQMGQQMGQQRMNQFQRLMEQSRGMRAATQPYTPVQGQRLNPGQTPQNPMFSRAPGNFAMPVQGQNNTAGKQSLSDLLNASNVSSAGRRRLV